MATTKADTKRDELAELLKGLKPVEGVAKQLADDLGSFIASMQPLEKMINEILQDVSIPAPVHEDMQNILQSMLEVDDYLQSAVSDLEEARKNLRDARKSI